MTNEIDFILKQIFMQFITFNNLNCLTILGFQKFNP
jgi:hypothetical protein